MYDQSQTYSLTETVQPTIEVERDILPIAIQHAMELWWDGSTPTKRLDDRGDSSQFTRFVNARIEGKLSEVAFMQFLEEYFNLRSQVDWRIYGDYEVTDDGDLQHLLYDEPGGSAQEVPLGVDFDVKKTKPYNSWLAVRTEIFDRIPDDAPVVLTTTRIPEDIQLDQWEDTDCWDDVDGDSDFRDRLLTFADDQFPLTVDIKGTAYKDEFTDRFEQGEHLYDPTTGAELGPPLKRPNAGIPIEELDSRAIRWNTVVSELVGDGPADMWRPLPVVDGHDPTSA